VAVVLKLADPAHPSSAFLEDCLERLRRGELLAGPTDTLYGLFCDPFRPEALARLAALKGQREAKPIPLLVADPRQAAELATALPAAAEQLMKAFWPGGLTIVVASRPHVSEAVTGGTGAVGLRQPAALYLLRLMEALGGPLTGTSANRAGEPPATTADEVFATIGEEVDVVIDGGVADKLEGSTVVEVTDGTPRILRPGVLSAEELALVIGKLEGS
jgi:tRNA threonylcarbamoyl adenosine modification protein (Sua5/YciO/YrdC/YwlC family)